MTPPHRATAAACHAEIARLETLARDVVRNGPCPAPDPVRAFWRDPLWLDHWLMSQPERIQTAIDQQRQILARINHTLYPTHKRKP